MIYMVNFNRKGKRMVFSDKLREARKLRKLSQEELGKMTGVSRRSVIAWENAEVLPRAKTMKKIAESLQVSLEYLKHDEITDPLHGVTTKDYLDETRERYGEKAAQELDFLLERQRVFFAGGEISQDAKDAFFEAVVRAYMACKDEAKRKSSL